jgi:GTPase
LKSAKTLRIQDKERVRKVVKNTTHYSLLLFSMQGKMLNYDNCTCPEEIVESSEKLISFIDLAGHYKYLRTTIFGLMGYSPHYVMLVISANKGVTEATEDHIHLALALEVRIFVVITKIDLTSSAASHDRIKNIISGMFNTFLIFFILSQVLL